MDFNPKQFFVVTGASSGIGKAIAILLNRSGASVIAIGRNRERLEEMQKGCEYSENIYLEQRDLTDNIDDLPLYVSSLKSRFGKLRGLVCCAGIVELNPLQMITGSKVARIFQINYEVPLMMTKGFADRRNNEGKGSSIVYISSIGAEMGVCERGQGLYSGSKAALIATGKSFARELITRGIRLNTVSPADIDTPLNSMGVNNGYREVSYPLGVGQPDDVASLVVFLLSEKAKWIAGQNYIVDCCSY